jgi:serine/threonine protein kinase
MDGWMDVGEVYSAMDRQSNEMVAIKVEKNVDPNMTDSLKKEIEVLRDLKNAFRVYYSGIENGRNYLVMELLGQDISTFRKEQPNQRFGPELGTRVVLAMLHALRSFHEEGYIHQDIKPVCTSPVCFCLCVRLCSSLDL